MLQHKTTALPLPLLILQAMHPPFEINIIGLTYLPVLDPLTAVCINGYGKINNNGVERCAKCGYGTYYSGDAWGSAGTCETCPETTFTFLANHVPVDPVTVSGTTLVAGATREEECVPSEQQFSEDVGAALFPDSLYTTAAGSGFGGISTVSTLANCKAACDSITKVRRICQLRLRVNPGKQAGIRIQLQPCAIASPPLTTELCTTSRLLVCKHTQLSKQFVIHSFIHSRIASAHLMLCC